ncbi:hypothetical protein NMC42_22630 [Pseudomonas aeruginosa]
MALRLIAAKRPTENHRVVQSLPKEISMKNAMALTLAGLLAAPSSASPPRRMQ